MSLHTIAFVGVGHMGTPMAAQLVRREFDVVAFDQDRGRLDAFVVAHGGRAAQSLADVGRGADAVITMLPHSGIVREVLLGPDGIATTLATNAIAIDMSTSDPRDTVTTGAALAARGLRFVDAPVMGGVAFAREASLDIMAGGDARDLDCCEEVLTALGRRIFRCGALGAGHALKAIANFINAATFSTLLEAMTLGRKFGLDTALMTEAFAALCAGRQHPLEKKVVPQVLTRRYSTGMALGLIAKDLRIATDMARDTRAAAPLAECVAAIWRDAAAQLGDSIDQAEIVRYWEERTGVRL